MSPGIFRLIFTRLRKLSCIGKAEEFPSCPYLITSDVPILPQLLSSLGISSMTDPITAWKSPTFPIPTLCLSHTQVREEDPPASPWRWGLWCPEGRGRKGSPKSMQMPHQMMAHHITSLSCCHEFSGRGIFISSGWGRAQEMSAGVLGINGEASGVPQPLLDFYRA